jgi:microcystin-dependent protein
MTEPFLGEIRMFSFSFAPDGWALCNGQTMAINQNQALFSILGTTYGGDGVSNFQLPNLQGAVPMNPSPTLDLGETGGETSHTLTAAELPAHTHPATAYVGAANLVSSPASAVWAGGLPGYGDTPGAGMAASAVANAGSGQPHDNMSPYLVLNFCIALVGIFPSRN